MGHLADALHKPFFDLPFSNGEMGGVSCLNSRPLSLLEDFFRPTEAGDLLLVEAGHGTLLKPCHVLLRAS